MLAPTVTPRPESGLEGSRAEAAAAPWLLKPIRLTSARSTGSRISRGFGLPGCGSAVNVPTSTNANPRAPRARTPTASLSKPAAKPSGPDSSRPNAWTRSTGSRGASQCRSSHTQPGTAAAQRISANPSRCAASAGIRRNTTENNSLYMAFLTHHPPMPTLPRDRGHTASRGGREQRETALVPPRPPFRRVPVAASEEQANRT